jgi:predicted transposase YbfD/YdcC
MDTIIALKNTFITIQDPRIDRTKKHNLVDIIMITLFALMAGMDGWEEIEIFAEEHFDWFKKFLLMENGIPSHDTMYRVFSRINPTELNQALLSWTSSLNKNLEGKVVAIDGKTLRGSFDNATGKSALHVVSAWVEDNNLVLGQASAEGKGHEITKIPELLKMLKIKNSIVTIDAIGCQKEITKTIRNHNMADYVIALKKNQPNLYAEAEYLFKVADQAHIKSDSFESLEKGHGRIEHRSCLCLDVTKLLGHAADDFTDIKTIAKMHSTRDINGKLEEQTRYFISSLPCNAQQIAHAIRTHWGIENSLHWRLDVTFKEDASRIRKNFAPENMAIMRRIAFSLMKSRTPPKMTVKRARTRMNLNWNFATKHFFTDN